MIGSEVMDRLTMTVRLTKELRLRVWLGVRLLRLAQWVTGGRIEIIEKEA